MHMVRVAHASICLKRAHVHVHMVHGAWCKARGRRVHGAFHGTGWVWRHGMGARVVLGHGRMAHEHVHGGAEVTHRGGKWRQVCKREKGEKGHHGARARAHGP